ncbi:MAG: hypothetical protein K2G67_08340 [Muribaculaceae bacterium]|nr:hypothetical protein [Muribaculaceae bacterium]
MKTKFFLISPLVISLLALSTSCTDDSKQLQTRTTEESDFAEAFQSDSSKPELSALDFALGGASVEAFQDYSVCFTVRDLDFLGSLDMQELIELKEKIMRVNGIQTEQDLENAIDDAYESFCENMDESDLRELNSFVNQYLEMPAGLSSIEKIIPQYTVGRLSTMSEKYVQLALAIDRIGRPLYNQLTNSTRSAAECRRIFGIRIALSCISIAYGGMFSLTGVGAVGLISAINGICDAIDAGLQYKLCLRTRQE